MLTRMLTFLRVLDEQRNLSLSNVLLCATLQRFLSEPTKLNCAALGVASVTYTAKKVISYHQSKVARPPENFADMITSMRAELDEAKNKISSLSMAASMKPFQRSR